MYIVVGLVFFFFGLIIFIRDMFLLSITVIIQKPIWMGVFFIKGLMIIVFYFTWQNCSTFCYFIGSNILPKMRGIDIRINQLTISLTIGREAISNFQVLLDSLHYFCLNLSPPVKYRLDCLFRHMSALSLPLNPKG